MPRRLSFARLDVAQQPLVFFCIAFMLGLWFAATRAVPLRTWLIAAITLWFIALMCWLLKRNEDRERLETPKETALSKPSSLTILVPFLFAGCFACGGLLWTINEASVPANDIRRMLQRNELTVTEPVEFWGVLNATPELATDRIYLSLATDRVASLIHERSASGTVQLIVQFNDPESRLEYDALQLEFGTRIRVLAMLMNSHGWRNPGALDFDEMLELRGLAASASVKSPLLIERIESSGPPLRFAWLYRRLFDLRASAIAAFLRNLEQPTSGVLIASLFGNRRFLSRDTAEAFRNGGTFHLLVISGMHVAMIALVVLWLTKWLTTARWLRYALVLVLMWLYALMVGAQPSVTRAVVMLTVGLLAQLIFRQSFGANTLAASALVLLVWNPGDLFNPSFQLSFLTVLVIVTVAAPLLSRLQHIGEWQPSAMTPYPPRCSLLLRSFAEVLFWNEDAFRDEMRRAPIHYRLEKALAARWLSTLKLSRGLQKIKLIRWLRQTKAIQFFVTHRFTQRANHSAFAQRLKKWHAGRLLQRLLLSITATLLTTICVQVGVLPLLTTYFHRFSLVAPFANVIESLLMSLLMLAGLVFLFVHAFSASLAIKCSGLLNSFGELTVATANPLSRWHQSIIWIPDYSPRVTWILYVTFFALTLLLIVALNRWNPLAQKSAQSNAKEKRLARALIVASATGVMALLLLIVLHPFPHRFESGRLSVTLLDVGQGDAAAILFPRGKVMLIDSGGRAMNLLPEATDDGQDVFVEDRIGIGEGAVAPFLWKQGIKRLDLIAASHSDTDHTEGFTDIVRRFLIERSLAGLIPTADEQFNLFAANLKSAAVPVQTITQGDSFEIDGVRVDVLAPFADEANTSLYSNNNSLVLKLTYGNRSFLFTGDIERKTEDRLLAAGETLRADVLKVAHHGSRTSSSEAFLDKVAPLVAVISVASPSPFGHPHADVMRRLQHHSGRVLQTSQCGAITISTDGNDLRAETYVRCE